MTHSFKPFDEDAIRRGASKEPETASLYLVYAEQTVESPAALQYVSESETARSADLFNSTSKILITNVPHKDVLFKLLPPADDPPDSSTPAAPAGNANRAGGQPLRAARADASRAAYNPRPDAEEHNRMATDLDAHMTSAGSFTPGSRLESIDDAQRRQLQRSLAKMNELPLRCCFQCAPHTDPFTARAAPRSPTIRSTYTMPGRQVRHAELPLERRHHPGERHQAA